MLFIEFTNSRRSLADAPVDVCALCMVFCSVVFFFFLFLAFTLFLGMLAHQFEYVLSMCNVHACVGRFIFILALLICLIAFRFVWRKDPFKFKLFSRRWKSNGKNGKAGNLHNWGELRTQIDSMSWIEMKLSTNYRWIRERTILKTQSIDSHLNVRGSVGRSKRLWFTTGSTRTGSHPKSDHRIVCISSSLRIVITIKCWLWWERWRYIYIKSAVPLPSSRNIQTLPETMNYSLRLSEFA